MELGLNTVDTHTALPVLVAHRFSELNLNGLKLNKSVVNGICQLAKTSCLSELMLQGTSIGTVSDFFKILLTCHFSYIAVVSSFL